LEAKDLLESEEFKNCQNISIVGVMGMASFVENEIHIRNEFKELISIYESLKLNYFANQPKFKEISMGMSGDYAIAIEEGSTMIRVGSSIFGGR
jgi:uncharacterized pyridoxal phosphate-containing UPF0001 family protein